jgi:oxygen-dependent protoporphyrinogen oxidase
MADSGSKERSLGSVAVVGAGVSGLAAAYRLRSEGVAVTVFEAQSAVGGKIQSYSKDGLIWEKGPNTMVETEPEVKSLIDELGLREKQQWPVMQNKRYVVRDGKAVPLPSNPLGLITTPLLSAQSKLKIFLEPFLWKRKETSLIDSSSGHNPSRDESVADFFTRHFGREVVDYLVDPFIAGTSGSDPDSVSIRQTFPDLFSIEESYGSLVVGGVKSNLKKKSSSKVQSDCSKITPTKKGPRGSFSFVGGMQTLPHALSEKLDEDSLELNSSVLSLASNQQGNPLRNNWTVAYSKEGSQTAEKHFDAVILTTPMHDMRKLSVKKDGIPYSLDFVPEVVYQPMSVVVTAFKETDVKNALKGFGVLVPRKEQKNGFFTLGTLFSSSMFPDRAPPGQVVFTTFVGGSRSRALASAPFDEVKEVALTDLRRLVGAQGSPVVVKHIYWQQAFPQYSLGYNEFLSSLGKMEADLPGLVYAGNHRGGLSVGKSIASGCKAAGEILSMLEGTGGRKIFTMASSE